MENCDYIVSANCLSCGEKLTGKFCAHCGEKQFDPDKDFSFAKFIEQTIDGFTHFDSKVPKSFWLLIAKPGLLTMEYISGRRVKYMKPIQIFLIASLVFYFIFPRSSAYFNDVAEMNHGYVNKNILENTFHYNIVDKLQTIAQETRTDINGTLSNFRNAASENAKKFFFLLAPVFALYLFILYRRNYSHYIPHVIFSLHSLSFFLLLDMAYIKTLSLLGFHQLGDWLIFPLVVLFGLHLFVSLRVVYQNSWLVTTVKTFLTLLLFLFTIVLYRQGITIYTLSFLS